MKLTKPILKDLIQQVYLEAFEDLINDPELDLPALPAEPSFDNEDPPNTSSGALSRRDLTEGRISPDQRSKIMKLVSMLSPEDRAYVFRRYGYYTMNQMLKHLNSVKRAEKGDL